MYGMRPTTNGHKTKDNSRRNVKQKKTVEVEGNSTRWMKWVLTKAASEAKHVTVLREYQWKYI